MNPILYLAPMHGITNFIFRNAYFKNFSGIDFAIAPFVMATKSKNVHKNHIKDLMPDKNVTTRIIPQILSNDPNDFIAISKQLVSIGYKEINWNLGCPYPMVANKFRGSGLLPYPERIEAFLEAVIPNANSLISVKIRLGRFSDDEIFKLIPVFNKFPLSKVIIHPRIGRQMYSGNVNLAVFAEACKLLKHKIIYNGDIKSLGDYMMLKNKFNFIDEWMIGRAVISNPFLPEIIKKGIVEVKNKIKIIKTFHDELFLQYKEILYGYKHLMDKMKEIWSYLSKSFKNGEDIYKRISKIKNINDYNTLVKNIFSNEEMK